MKRLLCLFLASIVAAGAAERMTDLTLRGLLNRIQSGAILTVQGGGEIVIASGGKLTVMDGAVITGLSGGTYAFAAADFDVAGSNVSFDYTNAQKASSVVPGLMSAADKAKLDAIAAGATQNSTDAQLRDRSTHTNTQAISTITGLQAALDAGATFASLIAVNGSGPNSGTGRVHWSQLEGVPTDIADGDDTGAGGSALSFNLPLAKSGDVVSINGATTSLPGSMSAADKAKLDGIAAGATQNDTDANLRARSGHTGEQAISTVTGLQAALDGKAATSHSHSNATTSSAGYMSAADKAKLDGIAVGATQNDTDANLRARSGHTGEQAISTVTGLQTALDGKASTSHSHAISDVTGLQTALDAKAPTSTATTSAAGLMSAADKTKLDRVDSYQAHGNVGASETISWNVAYHVLTLDQATAAMSFADAPAAGDPRTITLEVWQDGTGGRAATWPGAVTGSNEIDPTADKVTFIALTTRDGGTTIHALSTYSSSAGGSQDAFTRVKVAGQSDIVAGSATANFTVAGAGGISIETDAGTGTLTVDATGISAGSVPAGMGLTIETADLGTLGADFFVAGNYGTATGPSLGDHSLVIKAFGTVANPTVNVAPGAVPAGTVVTISTATPSAFFTVTNNGADPTYTVGTTGNTFTVSSGGTWEYRGNRKGWISSAVQSATYTIDPIPTLSSAVLQSNGTDIVATWPEAVSYGAGGSGGWALTASGGAVTVTGVTGGGTTSHTLTANRTITNAETVEIAYTQPGNGAEDSAGQDVATFSGTTVNTSGGPAGGGGFVPSDVAGLQAWYTGDDYDGTTATDLSSNSRNATQGTSGNRPSLQTAVINGHDVMRFDGGDDFLDIASGISVSSYTVFVVAKLTPTFNAQSLVSGSSSGSPDLGINSSDRMMQEKNGTALILAGAADTTNGSFRIYHYTYNGSTAYNYLDGVQDSTGSSSETFSAAINRLGRRFITDQYVSGDVAEVIIYNSVLSGGDQTNVVGYLESKYGL